MLSIYVQKNIYLVVKIVYRSRNVVKKYKRFDILFAKLYKKNISLILNDIKFCEDPICLIGIWSTKNISK